MLRRIAVAAASLLLVAGAAAWWWTLPPRAEAPELADAVAQAPADVDGVAALATPGRLARWLTRRPQATILLMLAAPQAADAVRRIQRPAVACAAAARGPLVTWWRGGDLAIAAEVDDGARRALAELAALAGLTAGERNGLFAIATDPELVAGAGGASASLPLGDWAALARCAGSDWWVRIERRRLVARTGNDVQLPTLWGPSVAVTAAAAPALTAAGLDDDVPIGRSVVLISGHVGWAVRLTEIARSDELRRLMGDRENTLDPGARRISGSFGELWATLGEEVAVASSRAMLSRVRGLHARGEYGAVRGADLAWGMGRIAALLDGIPGQAARSRALGDASPILDGLKTVRWRLADAGGIIEMEW